MYFVRRFSPIKHLLRWHFIDSAVVCLQTNTLSVWLRMKLPPCYLPFMLGSPELSSTVFGRHFRLLTHRRSEVTSNFWKQRRPKNHCSSDEPDETRCPADATVASSFILSHTKSFSVFVWRQTTDESMKCHIRKVNSDFVISYFAAFQVVGSVRQQEGYGLQLVDAGGHR